MFARGCELMQVYLVRGNFKCSSDMQLKMSAIMEPREDHVDLTIYPIYHEKQVGESSNNVRLIGSPQRG